jgi:hypothetical protein
MVHSLSNVFIQLVCCSATVHGKCRLLSFNFIIFRVMGLFGIKFTNGKDPIQELTDLIVWSKGADSFVSCNCTTRDTLLNTMPNSMHTVHNTCRNVMFVNNTPNMLQLSQHVNLLKVTQYWQVCCHSSSRNHVCTFRRPSAKLIKLFYTKTEQQ